MPTARLTTWLLALLALASPARAGLLPPLDPRCEWNFTTLEPERTWKGHPSRSPEIHALNNEETLKKVRALGNAHYKVYYMDHDMIFLCADKVRTCFALKGVERNLAGKPGEVYLHVKDIDGNKFLVEGKMLKNKGDQYWMDFRTAALKPDNVMDSDGILPFLRMKFDSEGIAKMDATQLGNYLADKHLAASQNAKNSTNIAFPEGIRSANTVVAQHLVEETDLTMDSLARVNWFVNQGINPYGEKAMAPAAGVYRGSKNRLALDKGAAVLVDLEDSQVVQVVGGRVMNSFLPADDVDKAMTSWLKRVNKLNKESSLEEVFELYKEFVHIHPFMDGNGRTGRVAMNYMLLKTGMPVTGSPSRSIYFTANDLKTRYVGEMMKQISDETKPPAPLPEGWAPFAPLDAVPAGNWMDEVAPPAP